MEENPDQIESPPEKPEVNRKILSQEYYQWIDNISTILSSKEGFIIMDGKKVEAEEFRAKIRNGDYKNATQSELLTLINVVQRFPQYKETK